MTAMCGMAKNFWQLALARMGVGAGEAGAVPPAQSLIADYYPPKERAGALGFYMMSSMAGYIIGMVVGGRSEEHTSELQSLMRISYAVFCLKKKKKEP